MLSPPLPIDLDDRLDKRADEVADGAHPIDAGGVVRVRDPTHGGQRADDAVSEEERHDHRRS